MKKLADWLISIGEGSYAAFLLVLIPAYSVMLLIVTIGAVILASIGLVQAVWERETKGLRTELKDIWKRYAEIVISDWSPLAHLSPSAWSQWRSRRMFRDLTK